MFYNATGIREFDWSGKYWTRWGDALKEAGFAPNQIQARYDDDFLIAKLIDLSREIGRVPVISELKLKAFKDKSFPGDKPFMSLRRMILTVSKPIGTSALKPKEKAENGLILTLPTLRRSNDGCESYKQSVILSGGEVLRTAAFFLRSVTALRRSEPQSKDLLRFKESPQRFQSRFGLKGAFSLVSGARSVPFASKSFCRHPCRLIRSAGSFDCGSGKFFRAKEVGCSPALRMTELFICAI